MKARLSVNEYNEIGEYLKTMTETYWEVFRLVTGHFPKNSKTIKNLLALDVALRKLSHQMEEEFFEDNPTLGLRDYGGNVYGRDED